MRLKKGRMEARLEDGNKEERKMFLQAAEEAEKRCPRGPNEAEVA